MAVGFLRSFLNCVWWARGVCFVTSDHRRRDSPEFFSYDRAKVVRATSDPWTTHRLPACPLQMAYTEENWKASRISCNWAAARVRRKINLSSDDAATRVVRAPDDPLRLPRALISDVTSHPISLILSWTTRWRPHSLSYI